MNAYSAISRITRRRARFKQGMARCGIVCKWTGWVLQTASVFGSDPPIAAAMTLVNTGFQILDWKLQLIANDPPSSLYRMVAKPYAPPPVQLSLRNIDGSMFAKTIERQAQASNAATSLLESLERLDGAVDDLSFPHIDIQLNAVQMYLAELVNAMFGLGRACVPMLEQIRFPDPKTWSDPRLSSEELAWAMRYHSVYDYLDWFQAQGFQFDPFPRFEPVGLHISGVFDKVTSEIEKASRALQDQQAPPDWDEPEHGAILDALLVRDLQHQIHLRESQREVPRGETDSVLPKLKAELNSLYERLVTLDHIKEVPSTESMPPELQGWLELDSQG